MDIYNSAMRLSRDESARRATTMSASAEDGLRSTFAKPEAAEKQLEDLGPLPSWNSGDDLVDMSSRDELFRVMERDP